MISVALIEDIEEIRLPLRDFLSSQEEFLLTVAADSVESFLKETKEDLPPDVILLDIGLPGISGLAAIGLLKEKFPESEIIMITIYDEPDKIFQAIQSGASGYLLKNTPFSEIKSAVIEAAKGGSPLSPSVARKVISFFRKEEEEKQEEILTPKEKEVIAYMADGKSIKEIANSLDNSIDTIKFHAKNIYKKLHAHSKAEAVAKYLRGEIR